MCRKAHIDIYNFSGKVVKSIPCTSKEQQINIDELPAGVYLAKVNGVEEQLISRFVKE